MYKVIKFFTDLQDKGYAYRVGDIFPHEGFEVSPERLKELSTANNKRGMAVIAEEIEVIAEEAPKPKRKPRKKG